MLRRTFSSRIRRVILLNAALLALAGCGTSPLIEAQAVTAVPPTPIVSDPILNVPSPIEPGATIGIAVKVDGVPGVTIAYEWVAPSGKGKILDGQGTNGITYQAPDEPGTYKIDVRIKAAGVEFMRSQFITVTAPLTLTNTPTATHTPTSAPETTNTPTPEPISAASKPVALTALGELTFAPGDNLRQAHSLPCENLAEGTYAPDMNLPIWPVIFVGNRYHPQDQGGNPAQKSGGVWTAIVRFGDCNEPLSSYAGVLFTFYVYAADPACDQGFRDYLKTAPQNGYPGLEHLPNGCTKYVHIAVTRQ